MRSYQHLDDQTFQSTDFSKQSLDSRSFNTCVFNNCQFQETSLLNTHFGSCTFKGCNLSLVKLDGCRFQDIAFIDCKIVGAEFFKCDKRFFSPRFKNCLMRFCNFSDLNLKGRSFTGSKIFECTFNETNLNAADFSEADLNGTLFHKCNLAFADFSTATRYGIDPTTNTLKKAKFSLPEAVRLMDGFDITIV